MGRLSVVSSALVLLALPAGVEAQVEATPVLGGTVYVGDALLSDGVVVLHHLTDGAQGELDSTSIGSDGSFSFALPNVPDPARSDIFFASVRHDAVLYFGPAITTAMELDSVYEIRAYDSILAPAEGATVAIQSRSIFFEPIGDTWRVTDLFQLRNDQGKTFVARDGGRTWSYPLPAEATNVSVGEGEMSVDAARYEGGSMVVRAALPPGERLFVVRYELDSPYVAIPTPAVTEELDVLIREPAPPVEVEGLALIDRIELEPGSTYRRFGGADVTQATVRLVESEEEGTLPMGWIAVILSLILAVSGLAAMRPAASPAAVASGSSRQELLISVARLDEDFQSGPPKSERERRRYEKRRAELVRRLRAGR